MHNLNIDQLGPVILVFHAHPDDEVFATGAATLAAANAGHKVHLRVLTGGEGRNVTEDPTSLTNARKLKEAMLNVAAPLLGITNWGYVTKPGQWIDAPHLPHRTIATAPPAQLAQAAAQVIDELQPNLVLTVGPDGLTNHIDHIACHNTVTKALQLATHKPTLALGAVLNIHDVIHATTLAQKLFKEKVGSGNVTGQNPDPTWYKIIAPTGTEQARRAALDTYIPKLGTFPQNDLVTTVSNRGDSMLLRLVLDTSGWEQDLFKPL